MQCRVCSAELQTSQLASLNSYGKLKLVGSEACILTKITLMNKCHNSRVSESKDKRLENARDLIYKTNEFKYFYCGFIAIYSIEQFLFTVMPSVHSFIRCFVKFPIFPKFPETFRKLSGNFPQTKTSGNSPTLVTANTFHTVKP